MDVKLTMVRHNEHSIKFLQLTDLVHVLQIIPADIRPNKLKKSQRKEAKKRKEENLITKLIKILLPPIR